MIPPLSKHLQYGWLICTFTSFSTVLQSYQDNGWKIMKDCVQWNPVYGWEDFALSRAQLATTRSVGQRLTHWAIGAPTPLINSINANGYTFRGSSSTIFAPLLSGGQLLKERICSYRSKFFPIRIDPDQRVTVLIQSSKQEFMTIFRKRDMERLLGVIWYMNYYSTSKFMKPRNNCK